MMSPEQKICLIIFSYLLGSLSASIIICKIKGIDIRKIGSKNPGATNTVRALGRKYGLLVLFLELGFLNKQPSQTHARRNLSTS